MDVELKAVGFPVIISKAITNCRLYSRYCQTVLVRREKSQLQCMSDAAGMVDWGNVCHDELFFSTSMKQVCDKMARQDTP